MVNLSDNPAKYISAAYRHMIAFMARKMEPLGIGPGQYTCLFALYGKDGQSQQSLSEKMLVDKSTLVRTINKLEELGYVERRPDPEDKRFYRIHLTPAGVEIRRDLEAIVADVLQIMMKDLSEEETIIFHRLIKKISLNMTCR